MLSITDTAVRQEKIYRRWAPVYDVLYARLLRAAHRAIAASSSDAGRDILKIGVGTGLVLPHYAAHCKIDGIDVSAEMITKAREKVTRKDIRQVRSLKIMDAHELGFPDHSFDAVTLPFVLTLLADPELALNECARVLRPGGQIVIVSRLSSGLGPQARIAKAIEPLAHCLGLSSAFQISTIIEWANSRCDVEVAEIHSFAPAGFFKLIRLKKAG